MISSAKSEKLESVLNALPGVAVTDSIRVEKDFIIRVSMATDSAGNIIACRTEVKDAPALFEFYTIGLSEKPKKMFAPYPLFHTPPESAEELAKRITDWQKEDDWTAISLFKEKKIIGFGLLKRFRSSQATSAIVIRDDYLQKGLGCLVQCIIVEQARLLNIPGFHIKVVSDNYASIRLHEKCGFKKANILEPPIYEEILQYLAERDKKNGVVPIDRRIIEMVVEIEPVNETFKSIGIKEFANLFGADEVEVLNFCGKLIETRDFRYKDCSMETREKIFLDVIKKCDRGELSVSGSHRLNDWRRGWGEILQEFSSSGGDLKVLVPKDLHGDRALRYKGNYITSVSNSFERDFVLVFRRWLYKKYFQDYKNIYEFGCGTGQNLSLMAQMFPDKRFFGMDWVPESQELLKAIGKKYGWKMEGFRFDFFNPDYEQEMLPDSLVYTSSALEQLGSDYNKFLDYMLTKKPSLCVNVECMAEYYDDNNLYDYVALKYHKTRNYLDGFLTRLHELEKEKVIKIIAAKRMGFGSLYHEAYMYAIWKIL